ncbi:phosphotransferase family protein [Brevibacillus parabrevis]|jgi:aminoglycoside 2''-phosphotransferase|uniref:6'-aminoglycoside N-acetyltransferase n=1 Tax=Brevibacillus parabrevis TaxID=54914 RepID=A0A4Y3PQQ0_BREPA|nr:aminoglycoside phosphotransferase family protein [Brevibacillus parabrevis]RNB96822.1 aminoglycoside phosphotransferase family protein [Brevibacillus parabrevis]GEB35537.1 6'-aminoglycoside N-acetyltransferase [Brevibacillus parabrevis]
MNEQSCIRAIQDAYPDFIVHSLVRNEIGQNNDVWIVNGAYVFRFPKYALGIRQLKKETAVLQAVQDSVSLPIPAPVYRSFVPEEPGKVFTGYPLLRGEPFTREAFAQAARHNQLPAIAAQLGRFLHELHSFPYEQRLPELVSDSVGMADELTELYDRIVSRLFPAMRESAKQEIAERFETYLADPAHFAFAPRLIHGDFGTTNILYDAQKQRITGIIDFGGAGIGDAAYDFAGLAASYGENFLSCLSPWYPDLDSVLVRMRFYRSTFALQEALFGIEQGDEQAYRAGMRDYV